MLEWHNPEGDSVDEGDTVVEVSTDKVDAEVPAPASGVITRILKAPDEPIQEVGAILAELDPTAAPSGDGAAANGGDAQQGTGARHVRPGGRRGRSGLSGTSRPAPSPCAARETAAASTSEVAVQASDPAGRSASQPADTGGGAEDVGEEFTGFDPGDGRSVTEDRVLEWHKQGGRCGFRMQGETVVEVSTDKVDAEVPAPASGTIARTLAQPDETVQVCQVLAVELSLPCSVRADPRRAGAGRTLPPSAPAPAAGATQGNPLCAGTGLPRRRRKRGRPGRGPRLGAGRKGRTQGRRARGSERRGGWPLRARRRQTAAPSCPCGDLLAMLAQAMNESRSVPTATSFRTLAVDGPNAKRRALNGALKERAMKVSFTHLVAWAIVIAWRSKWAGHVQVLAKSSWSAPLMHGTIRLRGAVLSLHLHGDPEIDSTRLDRLGLAVALA